MLWCSTEATFPKQLQEVEMANEGVVRIKEGKKGERIIGMSSYISFNEAYFPAAGSILGKEQWWHHF